MTILLADTVITPYWAIAPIALSSGARLCRCLL